MIPKEHIFLVGPPAVGKLTIGRLLSQWTGFPFYDNSRSIDTASLLFPYGAEEFREYRDEMRLSFYLRAKSSGIGGLISSCCLARNSWPYLNHIEAHLSDSGWTTKYILLTADEAIILSRVESLDRQKKVTITTQVEIENWFVNNWPPVIPKDKDLFQVDTSKKTAHLAAKQVMVFLDRHHG